MIFKDRHDAGEKLSTLLLEFQNSKDTLILGLPRGGVVTAAAVAKKLHLPLDITCPRKIGAPFNPELAIGAVTETGQSIFNWPLIEQLGVPQSYLKQETENETKRAHHRLHQFRKDLPPRQIAGKNIILIDDGLATGATMKAAINSVKNEHPKSIIVAIPVSPIDTLEEIKPLVDQVICIASPSFFQAVGQFYEFFDQTDDEEVITLLHMKTHD